MDRSFARKLYLKKDKLETLNMSVKVSTMTFDSFFVQWFGPYCLVGNKDDNIFSNLLGEKKGVYLLAIPFDGKHLVYYVGETGVSFSQRLMQHIQNYLSGFYRIFDPEEFTKGKKVLIWGGMWKSDRKDPNFILDFLKRHSEIAPKILRFIELFRVFLAPIDVNRRIREKIESRIAGSLNESNGIVSSFQDADIRYKPRRLNEQKIKVIMSFPESIMGLKEELLV